MNDRPTDSAAKLGDGKEHRNLRVTREPIHNDCMARSASEEAIG
jgi:hypothetical protein